MSNATVDVLAFILFVCVMVIVIWSERARPPKDLWCRYPQWSVRLASVLPFTKTWALRVDEADRASFCAYRHRTWIAAVLIIVCYGGFLLWA